MAPVRQEKVLSCVRNPHRLSAYIDVYLKEEIKEEALVRNRNTFQRFLEVAALTDGETINNNNIAQDCGVSANTVGNYFDILEGLHWSRGGCRDW